MPAAFTPTELANFLECNHRTALDRLARAGAVERPGRNEIERELLSLRGAAHEQAVLAHYRALGLDVFEVPQTPGNAAAAAEATLAAMARGASVIYQGALRNGDWFGRPDFLVKRSVGRETRWAHHYEVVDAKLAAEAKASAVLQLCAYTDALGPVQEFTPERFHIVPGHESAPVALRVADYMAYYRTVRRRFEAFVAELLLETGTNASSTYPEPVEHCSVCPWWKRCEDQRRTDDHLSLVANITRRQRDRLEQAGVTTLAALAELPASHALDGLEALPRLREQAELQLKARTDGKPRYRLLGDADRKPLRLPPAAKPKLVGLEALPAPTPGDLFLDLEGDAFVAGGGLEYLFGLLELGEPLLDDFSTRDAPGEPRYVGRWAHDQAEEKRAFEAVVDRIVRGRDEFKRLHVYHFGHRESDALKKLSCRHKTREAEVDQLLREHVLVDLHPIARHALVASVEGYTLKDLEPLHGFTRATDLRGAARAMQRYGFWLETRNPELEPHATEREIEAYNREDCYSTWKLRDWLERLRQELAARDARVLSRLDWKDTTESPERTSRNEASAALGRRLRQGLAERPSGDPAAEARRLLADLLDWHWREAKSAWWEYYRALELAPDDYLGDRAALGELSYEGEVGSVKQSLVHRYRFPDQDHAVRSTPDPVDPITEKSAGSVLSLGENHIDLKRKKGSSVPHPTALVPGTPIRTDVQEQSLAECGAKLAADPSGASLERAMFRLLCRATPDVGQAPGSPLVNAGETIEQALPRLALALNGDVLAIQGPPGSGKTHQAALVILELVRRGKRVGVTANSHEVCKGVLAKVHALGNGQARMLHYEEADEAAGAAGYTIDKPKDLPAQLQRGELDVVSGTAWLWSQPAYAAALDCLIIDEAGQFSLANALAVAHAARNLILVGDPAQLEQPQKGVHPSGADVSVLGHVVGGSGLTIAPDRGVFIPTTRRLNPAVCAFVSEVFYDGRLEPIAGLEQQTVHGESPFAGAGLRFVPVEHHGNTNQAPEEVAAVVSLVERLGLGAAAISARAWFSDAQGRRPLTRSDVLVVAPYNAQVSALKRELPDGIRTGTVDKFQGKEAPIVIYSMTTSTAADAPRGLEFLYSLNRLNVAVSRAKAVAVIVATPELVHVACKTPRQMQLVNGLCRAAEVATLQGH
jgi:predicted RecB family nuclease